MRRRAAGDDAGAGGRSEEFVETAVSWHRVLALAGVWWFGSLPVLFWLADVPRIQNTAILALGLMGAALPLYVMLASRMLRRWQATPDGARWVDARVADEAALARWQ